MPSQACLQCPDVFKDHKTWKNHISSVHGGLTVVCTFCFKTEKKFKRVSDLKTHTRDSHREAFSGLPADFFSENNGFWCSVHPDIYHQVIKPSARQSEAAVMMRLKVLDWTKTMGNKASVSRKDFLEGWKSTEEAGPSVGSVEPEETLDYFDLQGDPTLQFLSIVPGAVFADISRGDEKYRITVKDDLFSSEETNTLRSLTRRRDSLPSDALPFAGFWGNLENNKQIEYWAKYLGVPVGMIEKVVRPGNVRPMEAKVAETAYGEARLPTTKADQPCVTSSPTPSPLPTTSTFVSASQVWSPLDLAVPLGADSRTTTILSTPSTSIPGPSNKPTATSVPSTVISSANSTVLAPSRRPTISLPPQPSQSYRATKLLKMGGMPQWQPARRAWEADKEISFMENGLTIFWPPKKWADLDPQQKLLQWEFAAMQLIKARGENFTTVTQAELLDRFNFLALPGTAAHKAPRHTPAYMSTKSRLYIYEVLRAIANGDHKDNAWLSMVEAGAMMRDTSNDTLLKQCTNVNLRLSKDQ